LIAKEQGDHLAGKAVASLVTHRLLGMGMNVAVLVVGVVLLFSETRITPLIFNLIVFLAVGINTTLLLIIFFAFKEKWNLKAIDFIVKLGEWITRGKWGTRLNKIREDAYKTAISFHDSMKQFKNNPKALFSSLFYLTVTWVFSLSVSYLVFISLGFPVSWSIILITSAIVLAVKSIPMGIPFEVGLPEITMTSLYIGLGVPGDVSATATILSRIITLWFRFFLGFIAQQWLELRPIITPTNSNIVQKH
ncbi:MAG: flippase-like domain-containing protein, partial [Candidatus Bathyarchaeota archaeon]|nr:flippase-like domain-containing protein [Candidatus Bathyarchaeota archaeon]